MLSYQNGSLPPCSLEEHGAELALSLIDRAQAGGALRLPLLLGVHDPVHLVEALPRPSCDVLTGALVTVKAGDIGLVDVELGGIPARPLRHRPSDPGAFFDPARGDGPEPFYLGGLPEHRKAVGGHRDESVDGITDADFLVTEDLGHELEGILELGVEVVLCEGELCRRES